MTNLNDLLRLNLQFFAEGDDDGSEDNGAGDDANKDTPPTSKVVTMTQEELDTLIGREKGRVKGKYADYDDLKAKLTEYEAAQQAKADEELSAVERLEKKLADKEAAELELTAQLNEVKTQATQERIRNAFVQAASANDVSYVDAALKLADLTAVEIAEDGSPVGVDELVKALAADNPFLVGKKPQKPIGEPSNGGKQDNEKTSEQMLEEAADKAKKSGRIEDRVAFDKLKRQLG